MRIGYRTLVSNNLPDGVGGTLARVNQGTIRDVVVVVGGFCRSLGGCAGVVWMGTGLEGTE